jgi:hypothetical protein
VLRLREDATDGMAVWRVASPMMTWLTAPDQAAERATQEKPRHPWNCNNARPLNKY